MKIMKQTLIILLILTSLLCYSQSGSYDNSTQLKENDFNIEEVILNSTSLTQIMAKINFSFEQFGEKKRSNDGKYVTVRYKNSSLINPFITYTGQGGVTQILFMMPIANSEIIGKQLISKYETKKIDGEDVIQRGNLTYEITSDGEVGIIIIY
jgi:hypothetical protein